MAQVTHSRESHERLALAAEREPEPGHLGEPTRDQRDAGVGAVAEAVAYTRADRVDVLGRPANLDADDVARGVGPKRIGADRLRETVCVDVVGGCDRHRARQPGADLPRERRSR